VTRIIPLFLGSAFLIGVSWKSLRKAASHGFYRFFAWETILGLFLLNLPFWFYKPFSGNQIIARGLLLLSLVPLGLGVHALRKLGHPAKDRAEDPTLLAFEKTTRLVTSGIYHYIRHPLYSSLFLLTWGIFFKAPSALGLALAFLATIFLKATARADETECTDFFGAPYLEYMKKTKRFVPYIF
jgi:protein-S-isoprenylcysteine O-methyltransferase Ste14